MPRRQRTFDRLRRRVRSVLVAVVLQVLIVALGRLSWASAQSFGRGLGALGWHLSRRERRRALGHLALALPETGEAERRRLARSCFRHHGMNVAECLHLLARPPAEVVRHVEVEGWDEVERLRREGRPILLLTAHLGNWELLGPVVANRGIRLWAVVRGLDDPVLGEVLTRLRRHFGSQVIERGSRIAARQLLEALRGGGALCMLIDQDIQVEGVWVPFFGRDAYTPVGAAKVALRRGAAVVPAFLERLPDGSHRARFRPPLELPADAAAATAAMTAIIESEVRRRPEQWVWMHRRWRRRPPTE